MYGSEGASMDINGLYNGLANRTQISAMNPIVGLNVKQLTYSLVTRSGLNPHGDSAITFLENISFLVHSVLSESHGD